MNDRKYRREKWKKHTMGLEEGAEEFEELLSTSAKDVECGVTGMKSGEDRVICTFQYPYQEKGTGFATFAKVIALKIKHFKKV